MGHLVMKLQGADDINLDDLGMKLQEMKLFVVIISTNYLENDSLAKNWEYGFAMEHHIPVLPIAVESGLEEYPAARKQGKTIVSVGKNENRAETPDIEELRQIFPGLRVLVDGDNPDKLERVLREITSETESTPEKDYLIGLAFFNGIEMERNTERAVSLIVASVRQNLPETIKKLAEMYRNGDGIQVNYENSILWRKRLVEVYEQKFDEIKDPVEMLGYIRVLESLATCLYELSSFRDSLFYAKQLTKLMEQITFFSDSSDFQYYNA